VALANVANRQGRRAADHIAGLRRASVPSLGTAIVKVFSRTAAMTGWNEARLRAAARPYRCIHAHPWNHATYYPGAEQMTLKLLFDPFDGTILGAQAVGGSGVDKRIDILATAMSAGLRAPDLADLELAYAPPFSSAKDPVNMLGYMSENILSGECDVVEPDEVADLVAAGWTLLDVRTPGEYRAGTIPGAVSAPLDDLRRDLTSFGSGPFLVFCQVGQRGHTATELLHELGLEARNLDGGVTTWRAAEAARSESARSLVRPTS
jgi:rhodanese-related sulfurtransferase